MMMRRILRWLPTFYLVFPLPTVGYWAYYWQNPFYLLGIIFYYAALVLMAKGQQILLMIPLIFYCWFWYVFGFSQQPLVSFMAICLLAGALCYQFYLNLKKVLMHHWPDQQEALAYQQKMEELNFKIAQYQQLHPNEPMTPAIMEDLKNEVFFKK